MGWTAAAMEELAIEKPSGWRPDAAKDGLLTFEATAELRRGSTTCARWGLFWMASPVADVGFALPPKDPACPPPSIWISEIRLRLAEAAQRQPARLWLAPTRCGWGGYGFNSIKAWNFSDSGGALEREGPIGWEQAAELAGLEPCLLSSLPWDGLPGMWGPQFRQMAIERERLALELAAGRGKGSKGRGRGPLRP